MAEEIIGTEEVKEETQEEVKNEVIEGSEEENAETGDKAGVIKKIGGMIKDFVSGGDSEESEEVSVPNEFYEAAVKSGWDEDTIMDFVLEDGKSAYTNEELLEMIPSLTVEDSVETENPAEEKLEKAEVKVEDSQEDDKTQKLLDRIDALEKRQGIDDKQTEEQKLSDRVHRASQIMDDESKEFEVFGKTDSLPTLPDGRIIPTSPQMKARNEVWDLADTLHKAGMDFDNAMSVSLNAYKGKNLAKDVERNIIKGLKKRESKLSGKHTGHESASVVEHGPDVIREVARRAGREIN